MNQVQTVSTVSKSLGISSRMLRYYEQIGLIESQRMENYAYRVYDEDAIRRLRQIIILRKLRVPVKQIREIFGNKDAVNVIEIFERNLSELDEQITALSTIKSILSRLVQELQEKANMRIQLDYLGDSSVFAIVDSISFPQNTVAGRSKSELPADTTQKEEKSMSDLNMASESLSKLKDSDVRIIYLPPMTVAAAYVSGEFEWGVGPEATSKIEQFVQETDLLKIKPDARAMGFAFSSEMPPKEYEAWVSIPDDMEVKAPLTKKTFAGGMFAAHVLRDWNFQDWILLDEWAEASEKFEKAEGMPHFEEVLNYFNLMQNGAKMEDTQLDLLLPIKEITRK